MERTLTHLERMRGMRMGKARGEDDYILLYIGLVHRWGFLFWFVGMSGNPQTELATNITK